MYAKSGDIFCVYNTYLRKYTACQVTKIEPDDKYPKAVLLALDWSDDNPLTEEQLHLLKPLYQDFMYWNRGLHLINVAQQVPLNYMLIGNIAPLTDESTNSYASWGNGYVVYRQLQWQEIPQQQRDTFKQASKSEKKLTFAGKDVSESIHRICDDGILFEDARELTVFPCLSDLVCKCWHTGLYEYLNECPFLTNLTLQNHGQSRLDFSKTHLHKLEIDIDSVEELCLNDELEELIILGKPSNNCKIYAFENGRNLLLTTSKEIPAIWGLETLGKLHCTEVNEIDIAELSAIYPKLRELRLWGKPGNISNFDSLSRLADMERFSTSDLFGFAGKDIPQPESLPKLNWFWMSSLPEDAAKATKKLYKKQKEQGLDLRIVKARKPEWLAQNLDNPFRSWDGQENITVANAKKAADLYRKARSAMLALEQCQSEDAGQLAKSIVRTYAEGFNKMDKRISFIETVEREDIYIALTGILKLIPPDVNVSSESLLEIFDETRDF